MEIHTAYAPVQCEPWLTQEAWPDSGDKMPDPDPLDHQGHGTHVSGIVAGQTDLYVIDMNHEESLC